MSHAHPPCLCGLYKGRDFPHDCAVATLWHRGGCRLAHILSTVTSSCTSPFYSGLSSAFARMPLPTVLPGTFPSLSFKVVPLWMPVRVHHFPELMDGSLSLHPKRTAYFSIHPLFCAFNCPPLLKRLFQKDSLPLWM